MIKRLAASAGGLWSSIRSEASKLASADMPRVDVDAAKQERFVRNAFGIRATLTVIAVFATCIAAPASAAWKAASQEVTEAARDPRIAAVLGAVDRLDRSVIDDDHVAFAALLAADLVVNNPQNGMSLLGATAQLNASGRISYSSYERSIEFAGMKGDMVLIMGGEVVVPKGSNPMAGKQVHRRFTDLWKNTDGKWQLTARQSTIVPAP